MKVVIVDPITKLTKEVKIGWSWTLFLSGFIFFPILIAILLFRRKLKDFGILMISSIVFAFGGGIVSGFLGTGYETVAMSVVFIIALLTLAAFVAWIYLCFKGNELTLKKHLELGWQFADPDSMSAKLAKEQYRIA